MGRLGRLAGLAKDLEAYFKESRSARVEGISAISDTLVCQIAELNEDLLAIMDEPDPASVEAWLQQWSLVTRADEGRIEAAVTSAPLPRDAELSPEVAWARRRHLMKLRGLQVLLDNEQEAARNWVVSPFTAAHSSPPGSPCKSVTEKTIVENDLDVLSLSVPPSPRGMTLAPPTGGYPYRPPKRSSLPRSDPEDVSLAADPLNSSLESTAVSKPESPKLADFSVQNGSRPSTPSSKFIDGQYVALRPASPGTRLSPIAPSSLARSVRKV